MKFDVCLEMVFTDLSTEERILKIAEAGFDTVEFWFHDATFDGRTCTSDLAKDPSAIREACRNSGVAINNMVVNAPDGSFGGAPVDANDFSKYIERLHEVIEYAESIDCRTAITCTGDLVEGVSRSEMRGNVERAFSEAARVAEKSGFSLIVEPLNTRVDHAGYYLDSSLEATEIVRKIGSPNFKLLYDIYHMRIMGADVVDDIEKSIDVIGHFHAAGVPGRHELNTGELDYVHVIQAIEALGYAGAFGLEYAPSLKDDAASLASMRSFLSGVMRHA